MSDVESGTQIDIKEWRELIEHMTGSTPHKKKSSHGFRNYFCAEIDSKTYIDMLNMCSAGFVVAGKKINDERDQYFHATVEGCKFAGMSQAAIKRTFEKD
jgi:hypothetical protein